MSAAIAAGLTFRPHEETSRDTLEWRGADAELTAGMSTEREAELIALRSTMIESQGLPSPETEPLLHQQDDSLRVQIWPPARVR